MGLYGWLHSSYEKLGRTICNSQNTEKMKPNLLFDFTVNKENKTIHVTREFDANLELVWEAWTNPEILDQWWAPKPWRTETKSMDFREGGHWLYAMVGPKGEKHWNMAQYISIENEKYFKAKDGFCDENGNINRSEERRVGKECRVRR